MIKEVWYRSWFDSPYYHMLYSERDETEAGTFIKHLCDLLPLQKEDKVWDMACGNGRHALALSGHQLAVTGTDLSPGNIDLALKRAVEGGEFYIHDMRSPFRINYFSAVFNLFTSFGYFERPHDNLKVFQNAFTALKVGGYFVVDFFNAHKVRSKPSENIILVRNSIEFHIHKNIGEKQVTKTIRFKDMGQKHEYEEKVDLLEKKDFLLLGKQSGFQLIHTFGDYMLGPYDETNSDRLILIFQK